MFQRLVQSVWYAPRGMISADGFTGCDTCCTGVALIATGVTFLAGALRAPVLRDAEDLRAVVAVGIREKRGDSYIITTGCPLVSIFVTLWNKKDQFVNWTQVAAAIE